MHCLHALEAVSFHMANFIFSASVLGIHCHQFWCLQKSHLLQKSYHRLGLPECISVCKLHTLTNCIRTRGYASLTCSRLYFPTDPLEAAAGSQRSISTQQFPNIYNGIEKASLFYFIKNYFGIHAVSSMLHIPHDLSKNPVCTWVDVSYPSTVFVKCLDGCLSARHHPSCLLPEPWTPSTGVLAYL